MFSPWLFCDAFASKVGVFVPQVKVGNADKTDKNSQQVEPHRRAGPKKSLTDKWQKNNKTV